MTSVTGLTKMPAHTLMADMPVIVRHQDQGALRLDHRHDQALCREGAQRADDVSQNWTFCAGRIVHRHGSWQGHSWR